MDFLWQPNDHKHRLGELLITELHNPVWSEFHFAVAFVKRSGVRYLAPHLRDFSAHAKVRGVVGVDHGGTSFEGLDSLLVALSGNGEVSVFHNPGWYTFHPKFYLFSSETKARLVVGSGNLTLGGLFTNYEASLCAALDLSNTTDKALYNDVLSTFTFISDVDSSTVLPLEADSLAKLKALGLLPPELYSKPDTSEESPAGTNDAPSEPTSSKGASPFKYAPVPKPPKIIPMDGTTSEKTDKTRTPSGDAPYITFLMTLQQTDMGVGQTTPGASRRSPEIFIPLGARDYNPAFWGWDNEFVEDPNTPGKYDRRDVKVRLGEETILVNMMTWPRRHDFRIRSSALREAGEVSDILKLERSSGADGFDYYVDFIPHDTQEHEVFYEQCFQQAPNSKKRWGYI